ncbi:MAG: hypothetical protein WBC50_07950 [Dehalococcoidales bacterium]
MEVGDWITLGAVIVALGVGVASIIHTNILQRKARKERLLDDIIEWAMSIESRGIEKDVLMSRNQRDLKSFMFDSFGKMKFNLEASLIRSQHILSIASSFGKELNNRVNVLIIQTYQYIEAIEKCRGALRANMVPCNFPSVAEELEEPILKIEEAASRVMEEASTIKSKI